MMDKELALCYARVSTYKQAEIGHSLETQSAALIAKAEAEGYRVELILDNGSGRKMNRPKLNEALDRLNKGEAKALFAVDIDRLARNTAHLLQMVEMANKNRWRLAILSFDLDTTTYTGKLLISQLAVFAEFESNVTSERVQRQHQARRERGSIWGLDEGFRGNLEPRARELIIKEHAAGLSLRAIARNLVAAGIPTARGGQWHARTIKAILESPQSLVMAREEEARKALTAPDKKAFITLNRERAEAAELAIQNARKSIEEAILNLSDREDSARAEVRRLLIELEKGYLEPPGPETPTRQELRELYLEGQRKAAERLKL